MAGIDIACVHKVDGNQFMVESKEGSFFSKQRNNLVLRGNNVGLSRVLSSNEFVFYREDTQELIFSYKLRD